MGKKRLQKKREGKKDLPDTEISFPNNPVIFLILLTVCFLVYGNSLHSPFIWDDPYLISDNHFIQSFRYFPEIFKHHLYYSTAGTSNFYRPLQTFFLTIDYALWKTNPLGYHLTSLFFHLLTAWSIFLVIELLFEKRSPAFMVSLLFLVHPVNSTVVNYIASRADSQATAFVLLSFFFFLRKKKRGLKSFLYYFFSLVFFVMAILSKEMAIILPFFILAELYSLKKERGFYLKVIPFFVLSAIYGILRLTVLSFSNLYPESAPNLYLRLLTSCRAFLKLIGLLFFPWPIHIEKGIPYAKSFLETKSFLSVTSLALLGLLIFLFSRKNKITSFGFLWFFVCLLPMANIVPINTTLADHWLYLPGAGFILGIIGLVRQGTGKSGIKHQNFIRKGNLYLYGIIVCLFTVLTIKQNTVWKEPVRFYRTVLKYNPESFRAWNELGVLYLNADRPEEASYYFEKAVGLNERFDQALDNLGTAYDRSGKPEKAIKVHKKALEINPHNPKIYNNLGNAYNNLGQLEEALEMYGQALRLNPDYKAVYNNIGVVYYKKGMPEEAIKYWEKTLEIDPDFTSAANNIKTAQEMLRLPRTLRQ